MNEEKNVPQQMKSSSVVTAKPTWHRPTVTRIDMKQTMLGSGPEFGDFSVGIK